MPFSEFLSLNNPEYTLVAAVCGVFMAAFIFILYRVIVLHIEDKPRQEIFRISSFKGWRLPFSLICPISVAVSCILLFKFGCSLKLFVAGSFVYSMILLAAVDFKTQMLPDVITKPLIVLGIVQGYFNVFTDFQSSLLGAFLGYFILWSVNFCFRKVRGMDGMGYGDFKLLSAIGAWAGAKMLPITILFSSIIGIIVAVIILKTTRQDMHAPTPFGPSLVLTGFIAFLWGNDILVWYLNMLQIH